MKILLLTTLMSIVSLDACKANKSIGVDGKWKVAKAVSIISVDKKDWIEYQSACVGEIAFIKATDDNIQIEMSQKCDQDGDFTLAKQLIISKQVPVKIRKNNDIVIADIEFKSNVAYVNNPFLTIIGESNTNQQIKGLNTNLGISWGDETLKIFMINKNKIVFYFYAYLLVLEREQ